jgi:hypothetical protein
MTGWGSDFGRGGMSALSPFYPQLRTLVGAAGTAAQCHKPAYATQWLFDHLVGAQQERLRQLETECLGDCEIDDQFVLSRLLDR